MDREIAIQRQKIGDKLRDLRAGVIFTDAKTLRRYSKDQSMYQVDLLAVAVPLIQ